MAFFSEKSGVTIFVCHHKKAMGKGLKILVQVTKLTRPVFRVSSNTCLSLIRKKCFMKISPVFGLQ
jgi:hypothetical protein